MLISEIKYKNDEVLGNLGLSFVNENGKPYKTIILAGENGTGKTRILETLYDFLSLGAITPFDSIQYVINDEQQYKIWYDNDNDGHNFGFHKRCNLAQPDVISSIHTNKNNNKQSLESDIEDIRSYGVSYLTARSGFKTNPVTSTTTQQIDVEKRIDDKVDDYTSIKQLLVNISSQDNARLRRLVYDSDNNEMNTSDLRQKHEQESSNLYRFKKAFDNFFEGRLIFDEIDEENVSEKNIFFKKGGERIKIDNLSSGEKQIVFRGAKLLSNATIVNNGLILIDEPELSMHPLWQEKILDYYQNLFANNIDDRPQIIIATHSEYLIRRAMENLENTLIVVLKEEGNGIVADSVPTESNNLVLPTPTAAEINYLTFNIPTVDYHIALFAYLQEIWQTTSIEDTDKEIKNYINTYYQNNQSKYMRQWVYGTRTYETLCAYIRNAIDHPDGIVNQTTKDYSRDDLAVSIELLREIIQSSR